MYNDNYENKNGKKNMRIMICLITFIVLFLLTFIISLFIARQFRQSANTVSQKTESVYIEHSESVNSSPTEISDVSQIVSEVIPSVVAISSKGTSQYIDFFGRTEEYQSESKGSGIIYKQKDNNLYIVTNAHVVSDAQSINVTFSDNTTCEAQIIGSFSNEDLAVLDIDLKNLKSSTISTIKVYAIGNSDNLKIGEPTIAIGNALGYGQSVTIGIVSALNRKVTIDNTTLELIQTDAAINPGNSGGALLNSKGELIGINSAKKTGTSIEGVGYAIPITDAKPLIESLINNTDISEYPSDSTPAYLGINGVTVDKDTARKYDMPYGVYVTFVEKGSAAQKCGMEKGDIITAIDNNTLSTSDDMEKLLKKYSAGTDVVITVMRPQNGAYSKVTLNATLGKK